MRKKLFILQCSTLKSTVVQYNSWHTGAVTERTGKKSYWLEEGEEVGDGRAEGSSAIGDGGQAATSLNPDTDGTGSGFLLNSILSTRFSKKNNDNSLISLSAVLGLRCCTGSSLAVASRGCSSYSGRASHYSGLSRCRARGSGACGFQ